MSGPDRPPPSLGVIEEISTLGLKETVLKTALELDVFTTIASGYQQLEEIARATQCSVRGMRVLLDALCEQFDIVLLGNILHFFPPNQIQGILLAIRCERSFLCLSIFV